MENNRCPMPSQPAEVRRGNFNEVALGYTEEMAVNEAKRCLGCKKKPCVAGCPVAVDIPAFVGKLAQRDFAGAFASLSAQTSLPAICGRVCPQETQCEALCVRGVKQQPVAIGRLERFAADWNMARTDAPPPQSEAAGVPAVLPGKKQVAVVGAGPAGLTAAGELAQRGYGVTVFEALHRPGGVLVYGIPEFRLPKAIVEREINNLREMGVVIKTNTVIGKLFTVDELFKQGFSAVFIGSGAGLPKFMDIPGESLVGVFSANEFLTRVNLMGAWRNDSKTPVVRARRVAVVGGGNVAMDAARCALRLGAQEVSIVYRRGMEELPARAEEVEHALEEGVVFKTLTAPTEVLGNEKGEVIGMLCQKYELGAPDDSGRRRPVPITGSAFEMEIDAMIMSIGTSPNPLLRSTTPGLEAKSWGGLVTQNDAGATTRPGVWAGGDAVTGAATVILAMGAGKQAAADIGAYLRAQ